MRYFASLLAAYTAFALLYGASPKRVPRGRLAGLAATRAWGPALRLAALSFLVLSARLWGEAGGGAEGWLVAFSALMAAASLFVLAAPLWPRLVWGVALLGPPLVAAVSLLAAVGHAR